jgi:hypothetical protein
MPQLKLEHQGRRQNSIKITTILDIIGLSLTSMDVIGQLARGGGNASYNSGLNWDCGVAVDGVQKE